MTSRILAKKRLLLASAGLAALLVASTADAAAQTKLEFPCEFGIPNTDSSNACDPKDILVDYLSSDIAGDGYGDGDGDGDDDGGDD